MPSPKQMKTIIGCLLAGLLVLLSLSIFSLTRSQREIQRSEADAVETGATGFNFYGISRDTVLNRNLRQSLEQQLGYDAITHRAPLDLTIIDPEFTRAILPRVHRNHVALNPAFGGRREHAVTVLTYRRAQQKGAPFRYIKLVFDQQTGKPLHLVIQPADDDQGIFDALQTKYGPPTSVKHSRDGDEVMIWRKPDETLAGVSIRRRGGRIDRQLHFFFLTNIEHRVMQEREAAEARRRQADKASRRAF